MSTSGHLLSFSLFAFVRPLDRRIELGQIKENDSRGVTTLLSVTNTSVLFLRVRPYRSGRMNGPGQFRLKQAGEKKNRAFPVFVFRKYFCRSITMGTGYRGGRKESGRRQVVRASLPWNEMPPPCLMQCRGKKKEAEGLVPFLHLVRFGSLQGIARLWLDGAQSVSQCSRCRPLSLPPLPPTSTTTPTLYSLSSGNGHRFSSSFFSHCIHSSPSGVFVSTALCHRHPASIPTQTPLRTVDWVVDSSCTVFRPAAVNTLRVTIAKKKKHFLQWLVPISESSNFRQKVRVESL